MTDSKKRTSIQTNFMYIPKALSYPHYHKKPTKLFSSFKLFSKRFWLTSVLYDSGLQYFRNLIIDFPDLVFKLYIKKWSAIDIISFPRI